MSLAPVLSIRGVWFVFQAQWKVLLTGTPLQNSLGELFALLAFLEGCTPAKIEAMVKDFPDPAPPILIQPTPTSKPSTPFDLSLV